MATFISLLNFTEQGIATIKDSPKRLQQARDSLEPMGIAISRFYLTMGEYDAVAIIDAPDAVTAAKALLAIGSQGNISSTTLTAFEEDEYREIIGSLG